MVRKELPAHRSLVPVLGCVESRDESGFSVRLYHQTQCDLEQVTFPLWTSVSPRAKWDHWTLRQQDNWEQHGLGVTLRIPAQPLRNWVMLCERLDLTEPQFLYLRRGYEHMPTS